MCSENEGIAQVIAGSFVYKTDGDKRLLYPGALLLGNAGACYRCGHDHSTGDRCLSFRFSPETFGELAASNAGTGRFRFPAGALPAIDVLTPVLARIEAAAGGSEASAMELEELALTTLETVLSVASGERIGLSTAVTARDVQRISDVLSFLEKHCDQPIELDDLAAVASRSKYYFLRTFRSVVGRSPYQYLLTLRLRRAGIALLRSSTSVSTIAFDAGFGDLSTFNARFRAVFGATPTAFRGKYRRTTPR